MIDLHSLSAEWLEARRKEYKRDPGLIESMIYALHLVEQIQLSGLPFIFKGGTSLILLMERPLRFSVDIDIIVNPAMNREELESYLQNVAAASNFIRIEVDERRSYKEGIPKAHYKFFYQSNVPNLNRAMVPIAQPEREILLDVLFAPNPYPVLLERPIQTPWVYSTGDPVIVSIPCCNSIIGDKLAAFAPCTTGVPYGSAKEREIIKQLFDVGNLFELVDNLDFLRVAYQTSAKSEIDYRKERNIPSVEAVLQDTIATGFILARGATQLKDDADSRNKFAELNKGIVQFGHFVFDGKFRLEHAQVASAKAAYMAAFLLTNQQGSLQRFRSDISMQTYLITNQDYNWLNKRIKFIAKGEALFYWYHTIQLLYPEASQPTTSGS